MGPPRSVEGLVGALLEALGDSDEGVRREVELSLRRVGREQSGLVLGAAGAFLSGREGGKGRLGVLRTADGVAGERLAELDDGLAGLLVSLAVQEIASVKDDDLVFAATQLLLTLSRRFPHAVLDALLAKFSPGSQPPVPLVSAIGQVAAANAFGFIPFFSDILSRTVPMLSSLKGDALRRSVAVMLKDGCEALSEYLSNLSEAPDASVSRESFSSQISAAFEYLVGHWLSGKEAKVRVAVAEALGAAAPFIASASLREDLKKLVPAFLHLYKKSTNHYPITKGLCGLLDAAVRDESCPLEPLLEETWNAIFPHVCEELDYGNAQGVRNQSEVQRCFHVTAQRFADKLLYFLLQKMASGQERLRLGALGVLRHLVNSTAEHMADKRSLLLLGLKPVLAEPQTGPVKKLLCQLAVALADHDYLCAEGGDLVVGFLVRSLVGDPAEPVRWQCAQALLTIAANVPSADQLLWTQLLEVVCTEPAGTVLPEIFRPLAAVAERRRRDKTLGWEDLASENPQIARPEQVLCRVIVKMGGSGRGAGLERRGTASALSLLWQLGDSVDEAVGQVVEQNLPELEVSLEEEGLSDEEWAEKVLDLLVQIIVSVNEGEWRQKLAAALASQLQLYSSQPRYKHFLFRCVGAALSKITDRQFVLSHLELMFRSVNQSKGLERSGCARGVGTAAAAHTDLVLTKLENVSKWEHQRRSSGIIGFIRDKVPMKSEADLESSGVRATIMLSYGYLLYHCPTDIATQRLDSTVLPFLRPYLEKPKDVPVMECLVRAIKLIGETLHPSHLKAEYTFLERGEMLEFVKEYVGREGSREWTESELRGSACGAASALVALAPPLEEAVLWPLLAVFADHIFPLKSPDPPTAHLNDLYRRIVQARATTDTLAMLVRHMAPWTTSGEERERSRALDSLLVVLQTYYSSAKDCALGRATEFTVMGSLVGRLGSRLCDSVPEIRLKALRNIQQTLAISVLLRGLGKDFVDDEVTDERIQGWEARLEKGSELAAQLEVVAWLGGEAEKRLTHRQLQTFLSVLLETLLEKGGHVNVAAANLLRMAAEKRGPQLGDETEKMVEALVGKLADLDSLRSYTECLEALHWLARHHLSEVASALSRQPLPYAQSVSDGLGVLARDSELVGPLLEWVEESLDQVRGSATERPEGSAVAYAKVEALRASAVAVELVKGAEPESVVEESFARLTWRGLILAAELAGTAYQMETSASQRKAAPEPASGCVALLRALIVRTRQDEVMLGMGSWEDFLHPSHYPSAVSELASCLAQFTTHSLVKELLSLASPAMDEGDEAGKTEASKVVAVSLFGPWVKQVSTWKEESERGEVMDSLVSGLMKGLANPSLRVRKLSVRGLGNVGHCEGALLKLYQGTALSAMMAGLEDGKDFRDEVGLEAMGGLGKLCAQLGPKEVEPILMPVVLRLRPCLEKESGALRSVALGLLGGLGRFGRRSEAVREQIQAMLVSVLLHARDGEAAVEAAAVEALEGLGTALGLPKLGEGGRELASGRLGYAEFLGVAAEALVGWEAGRLNQWVVTAAQFSKAEAAGLRGNAALLVGALLGRAPAGLRGTVSKDQVFPDLAALLSDPQDPAVRKAAAQAIAQLHSF